MSPIRTIVVFQSSAFNTSQRKDYFINDCCYGDDVARWMIEELRARGIQTQSEPEQEDWGWFLRYHTAQGDYYFNIGYRPDYEGDPGAWVCHVVRDFFSWKSFFTGRKPAVGPDAVAAIHSVLSSSPKISNIQWHYQQDFDACREDKGQPDPVAA
jgi:hypothetical protein